LSSEIPSGVSELHRWAIQNEDRLPSSFPGGGRHAAWLAFSEGAQGMARFLRSCWVRSERCVDLGSIQWTSCLSSDMPRTLATARAVFSGSVETSNLLREAEFAEFGTGRLRLPMWMWRLLLRFTWMTGHASQRQCRDDFRRRVLYVADSLARRDGDTLVVSHAGMISYLVAELKRRGFTGPSVRIPKHSRLYVFEREEAQPGATDNPDNAQRLREDH
jgi:broad specificity phosphatase PhoE